MTDTGRRLTIDERTVRGVVILDLAGAVVRGGGIVELSDLISLLAFEGVRSVAVNLGRVDSIDEAGVETLAACRRTMRACGGELKLLAVPPRVAATVASPALAGIESHRTESALVRSFVIHPMGRPPGHAAPTPCTGCA